MRCGADGDGRGGLASRAVFAPGHVEYRGVRAFPSYREATPDFDPRAPENAGRGPGDMDRAVARVPPRS